MPRRQDLDTIIIIGAGPIVIGQACEFDYSGTQACKALRQEGYRIVLVNSNPATIMTDPQMADATYIEPLTPKIVAKVLEKERTLYPNHKMALLPTMGGQTALNIALDLEKSGVLSDLDIEMIGANADVIDKAEDRLRFFNAMESIGLSSPRSCQVGNEAEAMEALEAVGLPAIIRPSFTLAGTGGGIAYNKETFRTLINSGLRASPVNTVLVEESVLGWKEYEMEVVRDTADNCIIICSIENIDPMGVHTGDSITVAPALTLTDKEYQKMRDASLAVVREIGVETGGSNVQFAVNPDTGCMVVIEMNPRVSRSSALASKATGFPIAKIAAKLAVGYTLDELQNDITKVTPASFEPSIDYFVTKMPRFAFEKFPNADPTLTTAMKSVGEVMAIGGSFKESFQKALRSMETGLSGLNEVVIEGLLSDDGILNEDGVRRALAKPTPDRLLRIAQCFRHGAKVNLIYEITKIDNWFLRQIDELVKVEDELKKTQLPQEKEAFFHLKKYGFSDIRLGQLTNNTTAMVTQKRKELGVEPVYRRIDTCAGEFAGNTAYLYSIYEGDGLHPAFDEADVSQAQKVIILGSGPNRIGQGIEFDYCCVHACYALSKAGYETIMINCNPETVSTDYDTSDRLYFEPLTEENVLDIIKKEQEKGCVKGVIVQYGGQTPLKLAHALERHNIPILGTSLNAIDLAEDRQRFQELLYELGLSQPPGGIATSIEQAKDIGQRIGYPVVIRPSYVLGGRAMEIVHNEQALTHYMKTAVAVSGDSPVLVDYYLRNAIEVDVDVMSDGQDVFVAGIMEHIEQAGVHSGDSACCLPPHTLAQPIIDELSRQAQKLARALGVVGLMNVQFAVQGTNIFILEVNPRASRTVPFVAKATGIPVAQYGALLMAGTKLSCLDLPKKMHVSAGYAVKEAVFPFARFPGVDAILGPEMRSTGEVMGQSEDFAMAFAKAQLACQADLPVKGGTVFISVRNEDKQAVLEPARLMVQEGLEIVATGGTANFLETHGLTVKRVKKVHEGNPNIGDAMINGEVHLVFNTSAGQRSIGDAQTIRQIAVRQGIPYYTTASGCLCAALAIGALKHKKLDVRSIQSYLSTSIEGGIPLR